MSEGSRETNLQALRYQHKESKQRRQSEEHAQSQNSLPENDSPNQNHLSDFPPQPYSNTVGQRLPPPNQPRPAQVQTFELPQQSTYNNNPNGAVQENARKLATKIEIQEDNSEKNVLLKQLAEQSYKKQTKEISEQRNELLRKISQLTNQIRIKEGENGEKRSLIDKIINLSKEIAKSSTNTEQKDQIIKNIADLSDRSKITNNPDEKAEVLRNIALLSEELNNQNIDKEDKLTHELKSNIAQQSSNIHTMDNYQKLQRPQTYNPKGYDQDPFQMNSNHQEEGVSESQIMKNNVRYKIAKSPISKHLRNVETKEINELRQKQHQSLIKLENLDTRNGAMSEIQMLISKNKRPQLIRIVFSMLNEAKRVTNPLSKEAEVLILGYLAKSFGKSLSDPLDKNPSLEKSVFRLLELIQSYFHFSATNVQNACSKTWVDVYKYCFFEESESKKYYFLFQPLQSMITGGAMVIQQQTSSQVLLNLVKYVTQDKDEAFVKILIEDIVQLFLNIKACYINMTVLIGFIIVTTDFKLISPYIYQIQDRQLSFIDWESENHDYRVKCEVANTFKIIAQKFIDYHETFIGFSLDYLLKCLNDMTKDRILKVQIHARDAQKKWEFFQRMNDEREVGKMKRELDADVDEDELLKMRLGGVDIGNSSVFALQKSPGSKIRIDAGSKSSQRTSKKASNENQQDLLMKMSVQDSLEFGLGQKRSQHGTKLPNIGGDKNYKNYLYENVENDQVNVSTGYIKGQSNYKVNEIKDKTYLKEQAHDFVKKRSGTGGGFIKEIDKKSKGKNPRVCYEKQRERFKEQVMNDRIMFQKNEAPKKDFELLRQDGEPLINLTGPQLQSQQMQESRRMNNDSHFSKRSNKFSNYEQYDENEQGEIPIEFEEDVIYMGDQQLPTFSKKNSKKQIEPAKKQNKWKQGNGSFGSGQNFEQNNDRQAINVQQDYEIGMQGTHPYDDPTQLESTQIFETTQAYPTTNIEATQAYYDTQNIEATQQYPNMEATQQFTENSTQYFPEGNYQDTQVDPQPPNYQPQQQAQRQYPREPQSHQQPAEYLQSTINTVNIDQNDLTPQKKNANTLYKSNNNNNQNDKDGASTVWYQTRCESVADNDSDLDGVEVFDEIAYSWNRALQLLNKNLINEAYELVLGLDDDIYLQRLMCKTGVCYSELAGEVSQQLYSRVSQIARTQFIDALVVDFLANAADSKIGESMNFDQRKDAQRQIEKLNKKLEETQMF